MNQIILKSELLKMKHVSYIESPLRFKIHGMPRKSGQHMCGWNIKSESNKTLCKEILKE